MPRALDSFFQGGRLGFMGTGQRVPDVETMGHPGFQVYGGYLSTKELSPELTGQKKWENYADIVSNTSIVAAGLRQYLNLIARSEWTVTPALDNGDKSSDAAKEAADFFEECIYGMQTSWGRAMRKAANFAFWGFGIQEWTGKKREDGRFGLLDLEARPPFTIEQWDTDPTGTVIGVGQRSPQTGELLFIPRHRMLYLVDDALTDSPDGLGLLRQMVEPAKRLQQYLKIEGWGFERDLRGIPVGRAPIQALNKAVQDGLITKEKADAMIAGLTNLVQMQAKSYNTGAVLDSQPYVSKLDSGNQVTNVKQWDIELLTGQSNSLDALYKSIDRVQREMARILGVEHLMLGDMGGGSRALGQDKSRNFYMQVEGVLGDMAEGVEKDIVGAVWRMNGLPDELRPTLTTESVQFKDVEQIATVLKDMALAGAVLAPDDPAIDDLRALLGVSPAPDNASLAGMNDEPDDLTSAPGGDLEGASA